MPVGRPRQFDPEQALDRAINVFWQKGYEGASLPDLTKAMRINRPSLYAAFGNKEALFHKAVERYVCLHACHVQAALSEPTARAVVRRLWLENIDLITDTKNPQGCLLVQSALACGTTANSVRRELAKRRAAGEAALCERFEGAIAEKDLPTKTNAAELARFVATVSYGMAVQAAGGATRAELRSVAKLAIRAWPSE